jgi:hypothetical protein
MLFTVPQARVIFNTCKDQMKAVSLDIVSIPLSAIDDSVQDGAARARHAQRSASSI